MVGTQTNVVTAIEIHDQSAADAPLLPALLATTKKQFDVKEVSADLAYISVQNLQVVTEAGAYPYIPFKTRHHRCSGWPLVEDVPLLQPQPRGVPIAIPSTIQRRDDVLDGQAKFGDSVRSKTDVAMKNEVSAKLVCHNVCCPISAMFELGLDPLFWEAQQAG